MWAPGSRALSRTAMESGAPPLSCCSCARRSAADTPAGPPPTISTSRSSVSRSVTPYIVLSAEIAPSRVHGVAARFRLLQRDRQFMPAAGRNTPQLVPQHVALTKIFEHPFEGIDDVVEAA